MNCSPVSVSESLRGMDPRLSRLVWLAPGGLRVEHWRRGRLAAAFQLPVSAHGRTVLAEYLRRGDRVPSWLVVDGADEAFHCEALPRLSGGDRRALWLRRLRQLYPDTPWLHAQSQERRRIRASGAGPRERVLLSALTRPEVLAPWVQTLEAGPGGLAGLCSPALLSAALLPRLRATRGPVVMLAVPAGGGLRQSFFVDGRLHTSRRLELDEAEPDLWALRVARELQRFLLYLDSRALTDAPRQAEVLVLAERQALAPLRSRFAREALPRLRFAEAAWLEGGPDRQLARVLLSGATRVPHYATDSQRRRRRDQRLGSALRLFAGLGLAGALAASAGLVLSGRQHSVQARLLEAQVETQSRRLQALRAGAPGLAEAAARSALAGAAAGLALMQAHQRSPRPALQALARALAALPVLHLEALDWRVLPVAGPPSGLSAAAGPERAAAAASPESTHSTLAAALRQGAAAQAVLPDESLRLDGRVSAPPGREALEAVEALAAALRAQPGVTRVSLSSLPLDPRPGARLQGETGRMGAPPAGGAGAHFTLEFRFRPPAPVAQGGGGRSGPAAGGSGRPSAARDGGEGL